MKWILKVIPSSALLGLPFHSITSSAIEFANEESPPFVSRAVAKKEV